MFKRKVNLCAMALVVLAACSKQNVVPVSVTSNAGHLDLSLQSQPSGDTMKGTVFGLVKKRNSKQTPAEGIQQSEDGMKTAGVNLTRVSIALSQEVADNVIDTYLKDGYNVQIVVNWDGALNGTRDFASDKNMDRLKSQANAFFKHYQPYKNRIPFVAVENEWDWQVMHGAILADFLAELRIITNIGHQYGFKIADGGITSPALRRWTYSQLSESAQADWAQYYWIGLYDGAYPYDDLMNIVNTYIAGARDIPFDYSNVHWYNNEVCGNGFATASQKFMRACNKNTVACNEFFIRSSSLGLFDSTVNEIKGNANYALAYSGTDDHDRAAKLTDAMLRCL